AAPGAGRSSTAPGQAGAGGSRSGAGAGAGGAAAANGLKNGLFRGGASVNPYGPIQVTIRVANGRITGVAATHATSPARTLQVNRRAIPLLRQETLQAQSARINAVSGATYTSRSFAASLQSALAAARA
ncbi:FMN-binding protein, partial [Actinomadura miaoliensis]